MLSIVTTIHMSQPKNRCFFSEKLGSELRVVTHGGHCGGIFKEFPLLLDLINGNN